MKDLEKIYSDYYDIVFRYVLSLCRDKDWAEDITQDTFLKAMQNIEKFRGECKWSVWLCQIAKNTFITSAKRKNRTAVEMPEDILSENNVEQEFVNKALAIDLHKVLHRLDEPYKEVFWMRTFGELSFAEVAEIFNKSDSWARVTYYRAKMKLKSNGVMTRG